MIRAMAIATAFLWTTAAFAETPSVPEDTPAWRAGEKDPARRAYLRAAVRAVEGD